MADKLKVIIIDDDRIATEQLIAEVNKYNRLEFVGNACCGSEGRILIMNTNADVLFLDVEMPDCIGFDFLRSVRGLLKPNCHIVFYTAYDKYMINALREKAFDFLLKPVDSMEVCKVISRVLEEYGGEEQKKQSNAILLNTIFGEIVVAKPDDISFFSYDENRRCWSVMLSTGVAHVLRRTTKADKIMSFSASFMQVSKSHIINKTKLTSIREGHCVMQPPLDNVVDIIISRTKLTELKNVLPNL